MIVQVPRIGASVFMGELHSIHGWSVYAFTVTAVKVCALEDGTERPGVTEYDTEIESCDIDVTSPSGLTIRREGDAWEEPEYSDLDITASRHHFHGTIWWLARREAMATSTLQRDWLVRLDGYRVQCQVAADAISEIQPPTEKDYKE